MKKKMLTILLASMMATALFAGCEAAPATTDEPATTPDAQEVAPVDEEEPTEEADADSAVAAIQAKGELVMYTDAAFPPFEYIENNEVVGVDVEIAQALADELGVTLVVENVKFDTIVPSIDAGKADVGIAGMTITEDRKETVDFSDPYITSVQYIIVPEDSTVTVLEDLADMEIGVQLGTTSDFIISDAVNGVDEEDGTHTVGALEESEAEFIQYNNSIEAAQDLLNGRLGAVVADKLPAENIVANNEGLKCFELVYADGSTTDESYGIAIAQGSDLVEIANQVIADLTSSGKIDEFVLTHTGE